MRLFHSTLIGPLLPWIGLALCLAGPAHAQSEGQATGVPAENVRVDYAHVLKVEPVYETLRASRTEMRCEESEPVSPAIAEPRDEVGKGRWSRFVSSVRGVFADEPAAAAPAPAQPAATPAPSGPLRPGCRMVPVAREFRRPIAYDVDYVYKGMKYRSRLAEDPGNRLRIRVSVVPHLPAQHGAP